MFRGSTVQQLTAAHNLILSLLFTGHLKGNKVKQKLSWGINHCMGAHTLKIHISTTEKAYSIKSFSVLATHKILYTFVLFL